MLSSVAIKYARALIDVASETGSELEVYEQVREFGRLLQANEELREVYLNPSLPFSSKRSITQELGKRLSLHPAVTNFILIVLENGRIAHFERLVDAVGAVLDQRQGVIKGTVYSTVELEKGLQNRLTRTVGNLEGTQVRLSFRQDPALIGGLKLVIGSVIYDGSVRAQLDNIRKSLTGE